MKATIIVLSGPVCSGKSTLSQRLADRLEAVLIKTKDLIHEAHRHLKPSRTSFQKAGDALDRATDGAWVADGVVALVSAKNTDFPEYVVVDAVRIKEQVERIRRAFGATVVHVHLTASEEELARRYAARSSSVSELPQYKDVLRNRTERQIEKLANYADVVIETDRCTEDDVFVRLAARLGKRPSLAPQLVDILVGGQYGSEGKGNIASYLAPEYDILVRVGGPNAGHQVFRVDDDPFTFHLLPSGTLHNNAGKLVIGAGAVLRLPTLLREIATLGVPYDRILIDRQAMIISDDDIAWEKARLKDSIASTAQGVGMATARKVLRDFPEDPVRLASDVPELKHMVGDTVGFFEDALCRGKRILLEGTQGTSLSIHHGHYPHVTSRVTTAAGCIAEAGFAPRYVRRVVMVCRTYPIRVGDTDTGKTSGFMAKPIDLKAIAARSRIPLDELRKTETTSTTKRPRRIAEFDWSQLQRSAVLNGPTDIALTFSDYFNVANREAYRYEQLSPETLRFIEEMEKVTGVPVSLISTQFNTRNIIDRRAW